MSLTLPKPVDHTLQVREQKSQIIPPSLSKLQTIREVEEKVIIPHTADPEQSMVAQNANVLGGIQQMKKEVGNSKPQETKDTMTPRTLLATKMAQPASKMNLLQQKILKTGMLGLNLRDIIN